MYGCHPAVEFITVLYVQGTEDTVRAVYKCLHRCERKQSVL